MHTADDMKCVNQKNMCNTHTAQFKDGRMITVAKKVVTIIATEMGTSSSIILMIERIPGREIHPQLILEWLGNDGCNQWLLLLMLEDIHSLIFSMDTHFSSVEIDNQTLKFPERE